ncbi:DUF4190 domain-containing protein [Pseudarthrobacter sp. NS4]|uniref:DUF4190 domain-containing protein n=1 Tax=Pseudarthrobacter sp. NS4 TaxID=2973976 RepID=UPI002162CE9D|nr:DUF4190 domain-containing protein [Pseudarthrobacter sp. NS4]
MTDQPSQRPEYPGANSPGGDQRPGTPPSGYEPPRFVPPYGSEASQQPPAGRGAYDQGNQYGGGQYSGSRYGGSPYSQPAAPYGQPAYYGMPAEPKTLSIASMVCGIASVIMGWLLLPQIAAIVTGHMALKREPSGKGMSITGLVLGYLCLLGYGAFWLLLIIGLAYAGSTATYGY